MNPHHAHLQGGLVPDKVVDVATFSETAFSLDFNWSGNVGTMVGALITYLYLDFIVSCLKGGGLSGWARNSLWV